MCAETEAAVRREQPELAERVDPVLRREAIEATFRRGIALMAPDAEPAPDPDAHVALGTAAAQAGLSVEALMAGYRVGARVGWAHIAAGVRELGLGVELALALADGNLAYVEELAADSAQGFERAAAEARTRRARQRQAVLDALVAGDDARTLGRIAGWPVPHALALGVALRPVDDLDPERLLVGVLERTRVVAAAEADVPAGAPIAFGPVVAPEEAPRSLAGAQRLAALAGAGILAADRGLRWEQELGALVVHADPMAAEALARRRLAPLGDLPPARARMLDETLAAWLRHPGQPTAIGRELHLHPQTVRYRLARLRDAFGSALDDPEARFELALALRADPQRPRRS